jgi:NADH dehydrogenase
LVAYAGKVSGHPRPIIGLPDGLAYLQALAMEFVPGGPMSRDNYYSMQLPSVCAPGCVLPFGRQATTLEAVAPGYLKDGRRRACFDRFRGVARR